MAAGTVFERILDMLSNHSVEFSVKEHKPTYTSKESAAARGDKLEAGGKALVLKVDDRFVVVVIPADRKLDSKAMKSAIQGKKLRFATPEELLNLTGLVPGSVPPFGNPILPLDLIADEAIYDVAQISFNAGDLCRSITMNSKDHRRVAKPEYFCSVSK